MIYKSSCLFLTLTLTSRCGLLLGYWTSTFTDFSEIVIEIKRELRGRRERRGETNENNGATCQLNSLSVSAMRAVVRQCKTTHFLLVVVTRSSNIKSSNKDDCF